MKPMKRGDVRCEALGRVTRRIGCDEQDLDAPSAHADGTTSSIANQ
jgi:hypothetical protein